MSREAKVEASAVEAHSQQQPSSQCKSPSHLITLKENEWALWNWACLRSAGFPANQVLKLSSIVCLLGPTHSTHPPGDSDAIVLRKWAHYWHH